ncbi:hypothetical protein MnTg02_00405 [bacterium MnTg02]|nr:hypothetical protein MnTg02_00405 [bacterium MnTg02]
MAIGFDRANACYDVVTGLDKAELTGDLLRIRPEHRRIFFQIPGMFALRRPEIIILGAHHVAGIGKERLATFHDTADMVRVAVRDDHDVDIFRLETSRSELFGKPSAMRPGDETVFAIAGIKQNKVLAGVHHGWRKARLISAFRQPVVAHELADFRFGRVLADDRIGPVDKGFGVGNDCQLERAELEAEVLRLPGAKHRCRGRSQARERAGKERCGGQCRACAQNMAAGDARLRHGTYSSFWLFSLPWFMI